MGKRASVFLILGVVFALEAPLPIASLASDSGDPEKPARQEGDDRWVASLAITGGATFQQQQASALSWLDSNDNGSPDPGDPSTPGELPLRDANCRLFDPVFDPANPKLSDPSSCTIAGDDLAVSPFVGGSLELMTPALPIPTRPRLFLSGDILPTFASDRNVALEGDPSCVKGPNPDAVCSALEIEPLTPGGEENPYYLTRRIAFGEEGINGQGTVTTAQVDDLVFGASLGVAWPFRIGKRQLRIKPSFGWIHYEIEAKGSVVDGSCYPTGPATSQCTPTKEPDREPVWGYFRERDLTASASKGFHGIGPGLDLELDTGRLGPIGHAIFFGVRSYYVLGDRSLSFGTRVIQPNVMRDDYYPDPDPDRIAIGPEDPNRAQFEVEVDPWIFRTHLGIRFQWLGFRK